MVDTLVDRAGGMRGQLVRLALGRARALAGLRELPKFHLVTMLASARRELLTVGCDLERRDLLDSADDVFFLDLREVGQCLAGVPFADTVRARRAEYARELRRRHVPRVLLSDGTEPEAVAEITPTDDGSLHGTPASAAGAISATASGSVPSDSSTRGTCRRRSSRAYSARRERTASANGTPARH